MSFLLSKTYTEKSNALVTEKDLRVSLSERKMPPRSSESVALAGVSLALALVSFGLEIALMVGRAARSRAKNGGKLPSFFAEGRKTCMGCRQLSGLSVHMFTHTLHSLASLFLVIVAGFVVGDEETDSAPDARAVEFPAFWFVMISFQVGAPSRIDVVSLRSPDTAPSAAHVTSFVFMIFTSLLAVVMTIYLAADSGAILMHNAVFGVCALFVAGSHLVVQSILVDYLKKWGSGPGVHAHTKEKAVCCGAREELAVTVLGLLEVVFFAVAAGITVGATALWHGGRWDTSGDQYAPTAMRLMLWTATRLCIVISHMVLVQRFTPAGPGNSAAQVADNLDQAKALERVEAARVEMMKAEESAMKAGVTVGQYFDRVTRAGAEFSSQGTQEMMDSRDLPGSVPSSPRDDEEEESEAPKLPPKRRSAPREDTVV